MRKICNICLVEKELNVDNFYINKGMKDGFQNRCIVCTKQKTKERGERVKNDPVLSAAEKERHRQKYHRLYKGKKPDPEVRLRANKNYKQNFPEKYRAKILSQRVKPEKDTNHLHHWSYNIEDVMNLIELNHIDHAFAHRHLLYDQEHYKYRSLNGVLLETREQHIEYLKTLGVKVYENF